MAARTKRTYNLPMATVRRVRELAERYGAASTQDGVVELAVERLWLEARDRAESEQWAVAASDPEFQAEMAEIAAIYDPPDVWPR
jgi:hypothetical protein